MPTPLRHMRATGTRARFLALAATNLGWWQTVAFVAQRALALLRSPGRPYRLWSKHASGPVWVRSGSSDPVVFRQIFVEREYACLNDLPVNGLVIDAGANIGASSVYLLTRFPAARVVAVEPDPDNFALLERNLRRFADRVRAVRAGLWSRPVPLVVEANGYRDGAGWARQVREARAGEKDLVPAVSIESIVAESGADRISLLKIDIEGAETVVFAGECDGWLARVDALVIELHDDTHFGPATPVVHAALARHSFSPATVGELTVFRRAGGKPAE